MISGILTKVFGSRNERLLKTYDRNVERINALEPQTAALSDEALKAKTGEFRQRLSNGETLDDLLPEAFAVVREAAKRTLAMRHFDVQLVGGMVLHAGKIAEMRTGEGKTLAATLPAYLNALAGKGVHIVTVNDYLAARDADWMGKVYRFLGLTVGVILSQQATEEKRVAYAADITYGTNNEFGFDYLRDNMEYAVADRRQRGLVIRDRRRGRFDPDRRGAHAADHLGSGRGSHRNVRSRQRNSEIAERARPTKKARAITGSTKRPTKCTSRKRGHEKLEEILTRMGMLAEGESLYSPSNIILMHHLNAALRAHSLFHRDQQYVVQNGEIVIVDEFTGRMMVGRRWSEGLHQAVEAKEGVQIQAENQTYASITFQNYFRMYGKLAGMTGTADTEAYEFQEIYRLETVVIPTHRPMIRIDSQDKVYRTLKEKYTAIIDDIKDCVERGQPVLVGTTSIENSELLSNLLQKERLPHQVLNAKQHAREAEIIAQAGSPAVITIATNMAGRGTDIVLGGNVEKQMQFVEADAALEDATKSQRVDKLRNEWQSLHDKVVGAGGLKIIGSERHESRRIDNQLRGRSGRQGDPGASRFYLSMEDSLLRIFAGDKMKAIMDRLKLPEGEAIEAGMVTRSIESAQRKVEARNFDIRKQLLEYDDVANDQRREIYRLRNEIMETDNTGEMVTNLRTGYFTDMFRAHVPLESVEEQWDIAGLEAALANDWQLNVPLKGALESNDSLTDEDLLAKVLKAAEESYEAKVAIVGRDSFSGFERSIMLQSLDQAWREHLTALDALRQGIHLRGYAQKQPKQEYKREAFELFGSLLDRVRADVVRVLMNVRIQTQEEIQQAEQQIEEESERRAEQARAQHSEFGLGVSEEPVAVEELTLPELDEGAAKPAVQQVRRVGEKIGRNDPCPCGSGKKYKQCHGKL